MSAVRRPLPGRAAEPLALPVALVRRLALPAVFLTAVVYHVAAVARPCDPDGLQRRAALREALAGARSRRGARHPRRELLLSRPARTARAGPGVAAFVDDGCIRGREAVERRRHVSGRVPGVLARAASRAAHSCARVCARGSCDARVSLPRVPHVGGARLSRVPLRCRGDRARHRAAVVRGADHVHGRDRDTRAVHRTATRLSRRGCASARAGRTADTRFRLRWSPVSSSRSWPCPARSASTARPRTSASLSATSRTGPSTTGAVFDYSLGLAVVPGALFGLTFMLAQPRLPHERALAVLTIATTLLFLGTGSADRGRRGATGRSSATSSTSRRSSSSPSSRYAERGAPGRLAVRPRGLHRRSRTLHSSRCRD